MERSRRMRSIRVPAVGPVLRVRPDDHRRTVRGVRRAERFECDLELIRGSRQFGALGDDEAAPVVVELRPAEQGPPSTVGRPGPIFISARSGCEVGQGQDGQVDAGTAAIVAVGHRVDPGRADPGVAARPRCW